jgi:GTPase
MPAPPLFQASTSSSSSQSLAPNLNGFYQVDVIDDHHYHLDSEDYDEDDEGAMSRSDLYSTSGNGNNNIHKIPTPIVDPDDFSFYYRDEDEVLQEREDRLYTDENGIRRKVEKCILVGVEDLSAQRRAKRAELYYNPLENENVDPPCFSLDESMIEMRELVRTAGLDLTGEVTQRLQEVNPKTYIGSGKVQEAKELMEKTGCTTIVFDAELTPGQQKSLENIFNRNLLQNDFLVSEQEIKVVDRTALILDIFAQHARTREGKLQVDLALHEYRKPRLTKMWTHLERQSGAGGVGLRGPGESQLEIDRRLVRDRIITLKQKIDDVQKQRTIHRRGRKRTGLPVMSLVGYTNAGKSSVLNYLTKAGVMAESMLFATLDPTTRKVKLQGDKNHPEFLLTDTVGFIQKLPTNLVAAFRATLEEVAEADVLVHVIDVGNPSWEKQERAVRAVLADMGVSDKPIVRVLNKIDLLNEDDAEMLRYEAAFADKTVAVSALYGDGMEDFMDAVEEALDDLMVPIEIELPYDKGQELNAIHKQGKVETIDYRPNGTYVLGRVPEAVANRLQRFSLSGAGHSSASTTQDDSRKRKRKNTGDDNEEGEEIDWVALGRGRHANKE